MAHIWADLVFAWRLLRKSPAFALSAILTIALGVGVNTTVFSVVNAAILRPLPVPDSHRLVVLAQDRTTDASLNGLSAPDFGPYRDMTRRAFEDIAGYSVGFEALSADGTRPAWVVTTYVTGNYFSTLGISPSAGRFIQPHEVVAGVTAPIAVLGYNTWQRRFGSDRAVVGRTVTVEGSPVTIVGVAPPGFSGTQSFADSELYLPLTWNEGAPVLRTQHTFARLRPGVPIGAAQSAMDVVASRLAVDAAAEYDGGRLTVLPERLARPLEEFSRWNQLAGTMTMVLAALVLGIATVNVMNLVLARGADRRRELAVRAALGAGRGRLVRQLLAEAGLLAAIGSAAGVVLGTWAANVLSLLRLPGDKPAQLDFSFDTRVLVVSVAVTLVTALVVGLAPALDASRMALSDVMRGDHRSGGRRRSRIQTASVVAQVVGCFLLLVAAGLFVRSLAQMERVEVGFDPRNVANLGISAVQMNYDERRASEFFERLEERVRALPGVEDVSFATTVPLGYIRLRETIEIEGRVLSPVDRPIVGVTDVGARYFSTLRIPIADGRGFSDSDDRTSAPVAVVNQQFAAVAWPGASAIGRRFRLPAAGPEWIEVIGVTPTGRYHSIAEDPLPFAYLSLDQGYQPFRFLHARTSSRADLLVSQIVRVAQELDPGVAPIDAMTMDESLGGGFGFFLPRVTARFAGILALLAVALAVVGLYGLVSYSAGGRLREIGIRVALGATPADVFRLVTRDAVRLVIIGLAAGLVIALLAARSLSSFLIGVSARDPLTFGIVAVLLGCVALVACAIPARRAIRVDPAVALREE